MKRAFCIIIFLFYVVKSYSQCSLVTEKTNGICYLGMDNPLRVCIVNSSTKEIELKTENGKISKAGDDGLFTYHPDLLGKAIIKVYKRGKEIASYYFTVENIRLIASVGDKNSNDSIKTDYLISNKRLIVDLQHTACLEGVRFLVKEFRTIVFRGDSLLYNVKNEGSFFTNETVEIFSNLTSGDRITFLKIKTNGPSGAFELEDIHYYIKN